MNKTILRKFCDTTRFHLLLECKKKRKTHRNRVD